MVHMRKVAAVLVIALFVLVQAPAETLAQQAQPAPATSSSGFDPLWWVVVGAGTVGGWVAAGVLTDGLIVPAYWASVAPRAVMGGARVAGTAGPQTGAQIAGPAMASANAAGQAFVSFIQIAGRTTGAVVGGLLADSLYR